MIVSSEAASDFVVGELTSRLKTRGFGDVPSVQLTELEGYEDTRAVATELVAAFESLPWRYEVFATIPWSFAPLLSAAMAGLTFEFNDRLALTHGSTLVESHPPSEEPVITSLLADKPTQLSEELLYLRVRSEGYISYYGGSVPMDDVQADVRSFFGIALAQRWARTGAVYSFGPPKRQLLVYREEAGGWRHHSNQDIPPEAAATIAGLGVSKILAKLDDAPRAAFMTRELHALRAALQRTEEARGVLLAAQWLFDSWASSNRLLGFVQAMVALEALLGEKAASDAVGLGELLANRTAYLIAKSRSQRDAILADFRRIYGTRSVIVHRGKNRLAASELQDLSRLEWFCARVIQEEIRLLGMPEE